MMGEEDKLKQQKLETQVPQMTNGIQQSMDRDKIFTNYGSYQVLDNGVKVFAAED